VRQFFTLRYWLTLLALGVLVLLVAKCAGDSGGSARPVDPGAGQPSAATHHVDLLVPVFQVQAPGGVALTDGVLSADMTLQIDPTRTMLVTAGTPGAWNCPLWERERECVVAVDLLGDAVLWFEVLPGAPTVAMKVAPVVELLADNMVRLSNGWILPRLALVERSCSDETTSLKQFVDTFGDTATATFDFELQKIVKVTCPRGGATTTTAVPISTIPVDTVFGSTVPVSTVPGQTTTTAEPG
jgi:hypothetical protein